MASRDVVAPALPTAGKARHHFIFLDGLRGVAALCVACLHATQLLSLQPVPLNAGLAVDFFFCLSGFVIAYAYDERMAAGLGARDFLVKRWVRLYPMIFLGVLVGGGVSLGKVVLQHSGGMEQIVLLILSGFLLIPLGLSFGLQAFPVNNPIWSLFFESVANLVYAVTGTRYSLRAGAIVLGMAAIALIWAVWLNKGVGTIGFLNGPSFLLGFIRVAYPFLAGLLLFRSRIFEHLVAIPSLVVTAILMVLLMAPILLDNPLYDLGCLLLGLPAIVAFGARAHSGPGLSRLWSLLGKLSYPFYLIHQPIIRAVGQLGARVPIAAAHPVVLAVGAIGLSGILAAAALWFYDQPVRSFLQKTLQPKVLST